MFGLEWRRGALEPYIFVISEEEDESFLIGIDLFQCFMWLVYD